MSLHFVYLVGYDAGHPLLLVLDCEEDVELKNLYLENPAQFEAQMRDTAWLKTQRWFIVDGAHRHELCKRFGIKTVEHA